MTSPAPQVVVRALTAEDLDAVLDLEPRLFGAQAWSRSVYQEEIARPDRRYLAAEVAGVFAGYAGVALDPEWTVMTVGTDPALRRRGVAAALLAALIAAAREAGGRELFLEVRAHDGGAQQLYRNAGFTRVGLRRRYYQPEGADAVVMRLALVTSPGPVGAGSAPLATAAGLPPDGPGAAGELPPFVDVAAAHRAIWSDQPPVVLDVRWALGRGDGRAAYREGHLPGAVYVDLDSELAAPPSAAAGRHPLPSLETLQAAARRWGVEQDSLVLVYDDWGGLAAARAWWLLRWAGLRRVAIIDGGLRAWTHAGHHLESGFLRPPPGSVELSAGHLPIIDADQASRWPENGVLLDARAGERYRGEVEPVDPRAGHIPGARSVPTTESLTEGGWLRESGELREQFAAAGVVPAGPPVAVYCGSGVTASHEVAVLAALGIPAALYPGSWSQWSSDPDRPVATGAG